jgi:hypothetical protein
MKRCPPRNQLERLLARQLSDAERPALEGHVETCSRCQELLEDLTRNQQVEAWRQLHEAPPPPSSPTVAAFLQALGRMPRP